MTTPRTSLTKGVALTVAMRWTDRLIGVVSVLILARLLAPDDFGVIAMATLVIGLADVLFDLGIQVALIRRCDITQSHYDTAWSLRLMQGGFTTLLLLLVAPATASLFGDPRITPVVQWLALSPLLVGLENIGIVSLQRNLQFGAEFRFLFLRRIAGFVITIACAWWLRSYWALVIGTLAGRGVSIMLSYLLHPMRPSFSLARFRDIFGISQWMIVRSIGEYLHNNLHLLVAGRIAPAPTMGAYSLSNEIANLPAGELLAPINRVLFPALAQAKANPAEFKRLLLLSQGLQTLIALPAALGLALVAETAVNVLLGDRWLPAVPYLQILALVGAAQSLASTCGYVLLVSGRLSHAVGLIWAQVAFFVIAIAMQFPAGLEVAELAWSRLGILFPGIVLAIWLTLRAVPQLTLSDLLSTAIRPLLAAMTMVALLRWLSGALDTLAPAQLLSILLPAGVAIYAITVLALWGLAGRPDGAEAWIIGKFRLIK